MLVLRQTTLFDPVLMIEEATKRDTCGTTLTDVQLLLMIQSFSLESCFSRNLLVLVIFRHVKPCKDVEQISKQDFLQSDVAWS